jgi:hypothetical protein
MDIGASRELERMGEAGEARFSPEEPSITCSAIRFISERLAMEENSMKGNTKQSSIRRPGIGPLNC